MVRSELKVHLSTSWVYFDKVFDKLQGSVFLSIIGGWSYHLPEWPHKAAACLRCDNTWASLLTHTTPVQTLSHPPLYAGNRSLAVDFTLPPPHFPPKSSIQRQHNFFKASYEKLLTREKFQTHKNHQKYPHALVLILSVLSNMCIIFFLFWSILNEIQGWLFHPSITPYVALLEKQVVSKMSFPATLSPSGFNKVLTLHLANLFLKPF